jgi:hypothetical protein
MSDQRRKHPGGRPRQYEHPLTIDLKVRIDQPTNDRLQAFCADTGTQRATAVRQSVVEMLDRYDQSKGTGSGTDTGKASSSGENPDLNSLLDS